MPVECTNGTLGVYVLNEMINVQSSKGGNISMQHNGIASTYSKTSHHIISHNCQYFSETRRNSRLVYKTLQNSALTNQLPVLLLLLFRVPEGNAIGPERCRAVINCPMPSSILLGSDG